MTHAPAPRPSTPDELDPVAQLMEACLAAPDSEQARELERLCAEHPEHALELERRFAFLRNAGLDGGVREDSAVGACFGDFEVLEKLASGGMGVVYRARQRSLGREVALKLVRPELLYFEGARERFRRESAAIARLEHPGIVPVYAAGEERGVPYLAMKHVEGWSLAAALAAVDGRAPESLSGVELLPVRGERSAAPPADFERDWVRAAARVVRDVAAALEHAHSRGLAHRDVKPSNVLLDREGRAQLIDFGLSGGEAVDRLTRTGSQLGTLHYMAPERLRGERGFDARSDIYSLGVTLYELLALQAPFQARSRRELEDRVLEGRVDGLRTRNRRVDADLERVCLAAMASEPRQRYGSAKKFAEDLERWLRGEAVLARAPSPRERAWRWMRRRRALSAALLLGALLVLGVPSLLLALEKRHARAIERSLETERLALADLRVSNELFTRVLRDASPAHAGGAQVTLWESLDKLAQLARDERDAPRATARVLSMVGQIQHSRSEYPRAKELLELADLRLREGGFADTEERVLVLEKLGDVERARGDVAAARAFYVEAGRAAARAGLVRGEWPGRLLALEALTYAQSEPARAVELLEQALARFDAAPGNSDHVEWLRTHRLRLAKLHGALGDPARGAALIAEVRARGDGALTLKQRLELAAAESDLALSSRDFERAERVTREAFELARRELGERASAVATLRFQLGRAVFELGRRDEARELMEAALATRRELTGADSPAARQLADAIAGYFPGSKAP